MMSFMASLLASNTIESQAKAALFDKHVCWQQSILWYKISSFYLGLKVVNTGCPRHYLIFCQHLTGTLPHQILLINDSFSSQTWTILLPNRNFSVKSIWCPTRPPKVRSQNQGYAQYLIKIKRKIRSFPKTWPNSSKFLIKIMFIELLSF